MDVTTLGRGGTDATAVALAAALGASCEIYSDVAGVFTADPRIVPDARKLDKVSYEEMLEMAASGAKVLMLRAVELARGQGVRVHARSTFSTEPGTWIEDADNLEQPIVSAVTHSEDEVVFALRNVPDRPGSAAAIFDAVAAEHANVDTILQNVVHGAAELSFSVPQDDVPATRRALERAQETIGPLEIEEIADLGKVSLVGAGMRSHPGVAARMFRTLADEEINLRLISTSPIKVSCLDTARATSSAPFACSTRRSRSASTRLPGPTMSTDADATAPTKPSRGQSRGRSAAVWIVLVVAGLLLLLSSFAVWINRVALNTTVFASTSSSLLDDAEIRIAVANRAVDELFANVDVQAEVEAQLPDTYKGLSGAATAGLRQASYQIVDRALEQPVFQSLFKASLEESHRTLVEVLEGGGERVSTQGGVVTLDLRADHPGGSRPDRDRQPGRGQASRGRRPDRDPARQRARHRAERVRAPEDARLGAAAADAGGVRARRVARGRPPKRCARHRNHAGRRRAHRPRGSQVDAELRRRRARRLTRRSPGCEQRVEHPHRPHARLVPAHDHRGSAVSDRRVARRPRPPRVDDSRLDRSCASEPRVGVPRARRDRRCFCSSARR